MASATDADEINIDGLNKGFLLLKLVHGTEPARATSLQRLLTFLDIFLKSDYYEDACDAARRGYIDYFLGWFPIKADLRGTTVNPRLYDRDARAGRGAFKAIVDDMRASLPIPLYPSRAEVDKLSFDNLACFVRPKKEEGDTDMKKDAKDKLSMEDMCGDIGLCE